MADLGTTTAPASTPPTPPAPPDDAAPRRRVTRRRSLPGGRAVAGAFLITAAAVGVFAAYLNATAAPSTTWLVATSDISPGQVVTSDMLTTEAIELPAAQQEQVVPAEAQDRVVGRVALGPVRGGDLLQWTTVLAAEPPAGATTLTFSLPSTRVAFRGELAAGDSIDVVATYQEVTTYVVREVPLLQNVRLVGDSGASLTVALESGADVLALTNALDSAQVFIVRSDPDGADDTPPPFRPNLSGDG